MLIAFYLCSPRQISRLRETPEEFRRRIHFEAVVTSNFGGPSVLEWRQVPIPEPGPRDVVVKVRVAALNPVDWKVRSGQAPSILVQKPYIPGHDFAGVVVRTGAQVQSWKEGDEVFGMSLALRNRWGMTGSLAEYVRIPEAYIARKPDGVSWEEAAGAPLVSLTAYQCCEAADVRPGQRVLVHAGAGGLGSVLIQMAKMRGAYVITTCSERNIDFVKSLGADEAIDYTKQKFEIVARDLDVVFDAIGGEYETRSLSVLKRNGILIALLADMRYYWDRHGYYLGVAAYCSNVMWRYAVGFVTGPRYKLLLCRPSSEQLQEIARLLHEKKLKITVDSVHPAREVQTAFRKLEEGHARGKVVVKLDESS